MIKPGKEAEQILVDGRFQEIVAPFDKAFRELEIYFEEQVGTFEPEVQPLVRYCLGHSGKKLRPILVFSMALSPDGEFSETIIKAAAIVELVHLATLVHDDILDHADLRHRSQTLVARNGSHVAVLLGDALFSHALHLASEYPDATVCRIVSRATRQVCSGEIAQTFARGEGIPSTEAYFRIIDLKTAELFSASAYLGAYLTGYDKTALEAALCYARHLGIAYQIYDDAADIFGQQELAGKTLGTDLATGKYTLPVLLWLERGSTEERQERLRLLKTGGNSAEIQKLLLQDGLLPEVGRAFYSRIEQAREAVSAIPSAVRQEHLHKLCDFVSSAWNKFSIR